MCLRQYQDAALGGMDSYLSKGAKEVLISLPRCSGSTFLQAHIVKRHLDRHPDARVLITAASKGELVGAMQELETVGVTSSRTDDSAQVNLRVVTTCPADQLPPADLIICDHCDQAADAIEDLKLVRPQATYLGFSATPHHVRNDWDKRVVIEEYNIRYLQGQGLLPHCQLYTPTIINPPRVDCDEYLCRSEVLMLSANIYREYADDRPTLIVCNGRAHATAVAEHYNEQGIPAVAMLGEADDDDYLTVCARMASGDLKVVTTIKTMVRGVPLPLGCVIDLNPTKSDLTAAHQMYAALHMPPGLYEQTRYVDAVGNLEAHGLPAGLTAAPTYALSNGYRRTPEPRWCPRCDLVSEVEDHVCPHCVNPKVSTHPLEKARSGAKFHEDGREIVEEVVVPQPKLRLIYDSNKGGKQVPPKNDNWAHGDSFFFMKREARGALWSLLVWVEVEDKDLCGVYHLADYEAGVIDAKVREAAAWAAKHTLEQVLAALPKTQPKESVR